MIPRLNDAITEIFAVSAVDTIAISMAIIQLDTVAIVTIAATTTTVGFADTNLIEKNREG
jgi:hypothetical protein